MKKLTPEARALTESALLALHDCLKSASSPADYFAAADAILEDRKNHLLLPVSLGSPDMLMVIGNRAVDIHNAPLVHEYLGEMDRANGADPRLWAYLSHVTYRYYMEERWPLSSEQEKWKNRVKDRWLLPAGSVSRGALVRHGISRLWWVAHLTYMPVATDSIAKDDPYAYTREVFKSEDRLNAIFDREVGALSNVMIAVLDHAAKLEVKASDKYIQRIMQYLTLVNGYRDVGVLEDHAVRDLVKMAALRASPT